MKLNFIRDSLFLRIMRYSSITLALSIVAVQLVLSADGIAQGVLNRKASISVVNLSLAAVFGKLNQQTKVNFVYSSQANVDKSVSLSVRNSTLARILDRILPEANLEYEVIGERVVIKNSGLQQRISGKVTNAAGEALAGVNIRTKEGSTGTTTSANGTFNLSVPSGAILVFHYLGYKTKELAISGQSSLTVVLEGDVSELEAVEVVSTGYQTMAKKLFTGAATKLNAEDIQRPGITDVSRMLEGQAAGVSVQNVSGTFGAAPKIRIRGATSITGDNKPLWVVDGIVLEDVVNVSNDQLSTGDPSTLLGSSVAGINPDDIATFEILKDAAATSLYGARAMNGVILITTKRGKAGMDPLISYTGNFSTYLKPSYSQFDIVDSYDQMSVFAEMERKGWLEYTQLINKPNGGVYTKMAQSLLYPSGSTTPGLENTVDAKRNFLERYVNANTDWFDVLFKNSLMQEHSLSVTTGTEKNQMYYSTSFLQDDGWTIGNKVQRFTGNIRGDFKINDKLSFALITTGNVRDQSAPGSLARDSNPVTGAVSRDFDINPFSYAMNTSRTLTPYDENGNLEYFTMNYAPFNILNELNNNTIDLKMVDLKVQGELKYKLPKSINYSFTGAYRYVNTGQEHKIRENSNMPGAYRAGTSYAGPENSTIEDANRFLYIDPEDRDGRPKTVLPYGGFYMTDDTYLKSFYFRNSLDWSHTFNNDHLVRVFATQELRYLDRTLKNFTGYGYQYDRGGVPFIDPSAIKRDVEGNLNYYDMTVFQDRFVAFAGNASYSFREKYQFNGTLRYDGSNQLGESATARWLPTWNLSGSWNVDRENFMKEQRFFQSLTVRGTYGLTASMGAATNSSLVLRSSSALRPNFNDLEPVMTIENLANNDLTWEKQYEANLGIDMGMAKNRIQVSLDLYNRDGFDLIGAFRTPGIGGQSIKFANYADMNSKGIELMFKADVFKQKNWSWRTQLTNAYNKGKITNLINEPLIWDLVTNIGGAKVGYPQRGLFSIDFEKLNAENGTPLYENEAGNIDSKVYLQSTMTDYLKYEGPIDPTFTGGFYNNFTFKDFSFSFLVTYSAGNKVRLNPIFRNSYTDLDAMSYDFLRRFVIPEDAQIPSVVEARNESNLTGDEVYNAYNYATERIADGGFVRLKQVTIGYSLPKTLTSKWGFKAMSFNLVANNLWLIYADKALNGQDPEFYGSGGVALPIPRQFTLSFKASL